MRIPKAGTRPRSNAGRTAILVATALGVVVSLAGTALASEQRCNIALQRNVCLEANPVCPAVSQPLGIAAGSWPVFQGNVQHTGVSPFAGPTCSDVVWQTRLAGEMDAPPALAPGRPGEPETLFVPVGKAPLCALNPLDGTVYWCDTDKQGKLADRSTPVLGNGGFAYVGTRDNDLWAIDVPPVGSSAATVAWQQFVCTDGDITAPPIMNANGIVYMASDSLGAGTVMAMCPGPARQPKWCINPLGGGVRNASPALSPSGDELYYFFGGGSLAALDPETGVERWRIQVETKRSIGRIPNHAPVVNPQTGRIYLSLARGVWAVDPPKSAGDQPVATLLFDTHAIGRVEVPPAVDVAHGMMVVGVSKSRRSTLYGLSLTGAVQWQRSDLGIGRFRENNPAVIDAAGHVYLTLGRSVISLDGNGTTLWTRSFPARFESSPILADGRLYVGTNNGTVYAIGDCSHS